MDNRRLPQEGNAIPIKNMSVRTGTMFPDK